MLVKQRKIHYSWRASYWLDGILKGFSFIHQKGFTECSQGPWKVDQELYLWEVSKEGPLWSHFSSRKGCTLEACISFGSQDKLGQLFENRIPTPLQPSIAQATFPGEPCTAHSLCSGLLLEYAGDWQVKKDGELGDAPTPTAGLCVTEFGVGVTQIILEGVCPLHWRFRAHQLQKQPLSTETHAFDELHLPVFPRDPE